MTTTGELLVSLSDLSTGTALDHLMNITGGGGPSGTVLADFGKLALEEAEEAAIEVSDVLDIGGGDDLVLSDGDDLALDGGDDLELNHE